jgi:hypothetical protein
VARAQNKEERKQYLKRLHEEKRNEIITKTNVTFTYIVSCFFICLFYIINHMGTLHLFIYTFLFYNRDQISISRIFMMKLMIMLSGHVLRNLAVSHQQKLCVMTRVLVEDSDLYATTPQKRQRVP